MNRRILSGMLGVFALMAILTLPGVGSADPIGPGDCETCAGNQITLQFSNLVNEAGPNSTVDITLIIDTSQTTLSATDVIRDVAPKVVSNSTDIVDVDLTSAPGGTGAWTTAIAGLNNNGCDGSDKNGFFCSSDADVALTDGSTYTWVWHLEFLDSQLLTGAGAASIKARYCVGGSDCNDKNFQGITSENITLQSPPPGVPEPGTIMLLGTGLVGLGLARRVISRRRR